MRIACLQFAPQVGDVDNNLNRADAVLSKANPQDLDLLVLPELAFSGYNFKSLQHISPYLEPSAAGITSLWARTTALKYDCIVHVGYPEKVDVAKKWPTSPEYYNSTITINPDGETIGHYRKSHLYYTDETWALEGPEGFFGDEVEGLGNVAMGIFATADGTNLGMDLNPYKFEAPWHAHEFAYHILHKHSNLVILSLAWLTREESRSFTRTPKEPDLETLSYWMDRLEPIIRAEAEGEIIVVFANRTGMEDEAVYAGTSAVLGIHNGEVKVYGILGRGEKELLVVDTSKPPKAKLVSERKAPEPAPTSASSSSTAATASSTSQEVGEPMSPDTDAEECYYWTNDSTFSVIQKNGILSIDDHGEASEMDLNVVSDTSSLWSSTQRPEPKRPESPKSRNASRSGQRELRERALVSHDLAEELQPVVHPIDGNAPPHSASPSWTDPNSKKRDSLGPRSQHISPRPKSTVW